MSTAMWMMALVLALVSTVPRTNLEVAEEAVIIACQGIASMLYDADATSISLSMVGDHDANWLVEQSVTTILSEAGITVLGETRDSSGPIPTVELRLMDVSVRYGDPHRSWFLGSRKVERTAVVEVSAILRATDGSVMFSERFGGQQTDELSLGDVSQVGGTGTEESWLTPEVPESDGGGVLEPVIVTGVIASLIYLFYSSRAE